MLLNPRLGQRVRVHYNKRLRAIMPHHGKFGFVRIVSRGKPRNHGVEIDGQVIAIPCGNLLPDIAGGLPARVDALHVLSPFHSWQIHRVSATTFHQDVAVTLHRRGQPVRDKELAAIAGLIRRGECYRCRIAKGRFFFGKTPEAAAQAAAAGRRRKGRAS